MACCTTSSSSIGDGHVDAPPGSATERLLVAGGQLVLSYWTDPNTITVAVDCLDNSAGANLCGAAPCRPSGSGDVAIITVSADLAYQDLGLMALFGGAPFAFTVSHEEYSIGE